MMRYGEPLTYKTPRGVTGRIGGPPWPYPMMEERDGRWWVEYISDDTWQFLGWTPKAASPLRRALQHYRIGRLNGYPLTACLVYAMRDWQWRRKASTDEEG